jgi:hypothetical protein
MGRTVMRAAGSCIDAQSEAEPISASYRRSCLTEGFGTMDIAFGAAVYLALGLCHPAMEVPK